MTEVDCESKLFRDDSRGLEGGSFHVATLLNRTKAKSGKGKECIDEIKDYIHLKTKVRFAHYFLHKYAMDPTVDNTPLSIKSSRKEEQLFYLHNLTAIALKDLPPHFNDCALRDPRRELEDHPLQEGRRDKYKLHTILPRECVEDVPRIRNSINTSGKF